MQTRDSSEVLHVECEQRIAFLSGDASNKKVSDFDSIPRFLELRKGLSGSFGRLDVEPQ